MSNNKQSSIEWLINEIDMQYPHINIRWKEQMIDKVKEMHKEEIIDATCLNEYVNEDDREIGERYYNETFNNNE